MYKFLAESLMKIVLSRLQFVFNMTSQDKLRPSKNDAWLLHEKNAELGRPRTTQVTESAIEQ